MYTNKNQISIFILISVIIILMSVFVIHINKQNQEIQEIDPELNTYNLNFLQVKDSFQLCLDDTLKESIHSISKTSAFYDLKDNQDIFYDYNIPIAVYLDDSQIQIPNIQVIEKEIDKYIANNVYDCLNQSKKNFENLGYTIIIGNNDNDGNNNDDNDFNSQTTIVNNLISTQYNLIFTIEYEDQSTTYNNIFSNYNYNFMEKYIIVENFIKYIKDNNLKGVPIGYLIEYSTENNFSYEYFFYNNNEVIFRFKFQEEGEELLIYAFGIRFDNN